MSPTVTSNEWEGVVPPKGRRLRWSRVLWALIYPRRGQRTIPTTSGTVLIALSFGIGSAAYNAANNILFIALSLMLSCLILSGVLSWLNFRRVSWRLRPPSSFRAGHETLIPLEVRNSKRLLPTYGLWFAMSAKPVESAERAAPSRNHTLREILARAGRDRVRGRLFLRGRLDGDSEARLDWTFKPVRRGRHQVVVESVGSLFPFGFLQKNLVVETSRDIVVWPAPVEYRRINSGLPQARPAGSRAVGAGTGGDLVGLRKYAAGDSHSVIHWKASARVRELLVRQFAAESQEVFSVWLQSSSDLWPRPEQFELAVSFAASLAEDLFRGGKLRAVAVGNGDPAPVRRSRDLDAFLDDLAVVQIEPAASDARAGTSRGRSLVTFVPEGSRGVVARVDGQPLAAV